MMTDTTTQDSNFKTTAPEQNGIGEASYDPNTGFTTSSGYINVYSFDSYGAYTGVEKLRLAAGQSVGGSQTFIAPPTAPAGEVAVFTPATKTWALVQDLRGTVIYSTINGRQGKVFEPGPIPEGYTTIAPATPYDKWDSSKGLWVTDVDAEHKALQNQAKNLLVNDITNNINFLKLFGQTPGPQYVAYIRAITAIAWGQDTTSTSLPTAPIDPAQ